MIHSETKSQILLWNDVREVLDGMEETQIMDTGEHESIQGG
jgi:hypothetical protein